MTTLLSLPDHLLEVIAQELIHLHPAFPGEHPRLLADTHAFVSLAHTCSRLRRACRSRITTLFFDYERLVTSRIYGARSYKTPLLRMGGEHLRELSLHSTPLDSRAQHIALESMETMTNLRSLKISSCEKGHQFFIALASLHREQAPMNGRARMPLLPSLEKLTLELVVIRTTYLPLSAEPCDPEMHDAVVNALVEDEGEDGVHPRFANLTHLAVSPMQFAKVQSIRRMLRAVGRNLRHFRLYNTSGACPMEVAHAVATHCVRLESLEFWGLTRCEIAQPVWEQVMPKVQSLLLQRAMWRPHQLSKAIRARCLREIQICKCTMVSASDVVEAVAPEHGSLGSLRSLTLTNFTDLCDEDVARLCGETPRGSRPSTMRQLVVISCGAEGKISRSTFAEICYARRRLGEHLEVRLIDNYFDIGLAAFGSPFSTVGDRSGGREGTKLALKLKPEEMNTAGRYRVTTHDFEACEVVWPAGMPQVGSGIAPDRVPRDPRRGPIPWSLYACNTVNRS